jgi:hypothetical protein
LIVTRRPPPAPGLQAAPADPPASAACALPQAG